MIAQRLRASLWLTALLLAACGGGGGARSVPSTVATNAPATGSGGTGTLGISITVPSSSSASTARAPRYVSPSTASLTVALQGASSPLATVNLTTGSTGCSPVPLGTLCTVSVNAPVGTNTYVVTTYSATNAGGQQLSTASLSETVAANATNSLPLILNGVDTTATVVLGTTSIGVGTATSVSVTVVAYDASGNVIVGPGNYSTPVTLTDSDTSGATSLSSAGSSGTTATITGPGQTVSLAYSGGSLLAATVTPTIGETTTGMVAATLTPTGYAVTNYNLPATDDYDIDSLAAGPDGNVWYGTYDIIGKVTSQGAFTEYASANSVPPADIEALSAGPDGNLWFGACSEGCGLGRIAPGGTVTSPLTISGGCGSSLCSYPDWMVAGPPGVGGVWFDDSDGLVGEINTSALTAQEWYLGNFCDCETSPDQMAFGTDGNIYIADYDDSIDQVTLSGGVPSGVVQVPIPSGCNGYGLVSGPDGNIWFSDACGNIGEFAPSNNFAGTTIQMWSLSGATDGEALEVLASSPGGVWGTADESNDIYRITNLSSVSGDPGFSESASAARRPATASTSVTPPTVIPVQVFASVSCENFAIALGPDGNVWTANSGTTPVSLAKVVYGAAGTGSSASGTQTTTALKLGPMSRTRSTKGQSRFGPQAKRNVQCCC